MGTWVGEECLSESGTLRWARCALNNPRFALAAVRRSLGCLACLILSACASSPFYSHDARMTPLLAIAANGGASSAAEQLHSDDTSDPLLDLERGELLREAQRFADSNSLWQAADAAFTAQDAQYDDADRWLDGTLSVLVNDRVRAYQGHGFERVLLASGMAMNHIADGHWDLARVEIKKSHELEARIAEQEAKRLVALEKKAAQKKPPSFKQLGAYPTETIDAPEVIALRNGYQSAFSHYLAGFVYEALGETSLAAAGYRQAIELQPNQPILEDGLRDLEARQNRSDNNTDVLIVIEDGWAPALRSQDIQFPVVTGDGYGNVQMHPMAVSFPVLKLSPDRGDPNNLAIDNQALDLALATDTSLLARRALRDAMPYIIMRTAARVAVRTVGSTALSERSNDNLAAGLLSMAVDITGLVLEQADDRCWRSLPGRFWVGRLSLSPGMHLLTVGGQGSMPLDISAAHKQQLVVLRRFGNRLSRLQ